MPGITLDGGRHVLATSTAEVALTPLEFSFLTALTAAPGQVRRFADLVEEVWGTDHVGDLAQVHSVVKRLRRKLEKAEAPVLIEALRGVGFRLVHRRPGPPRSQPQRSGSITRLR